MKKLSKQSEVEMIQCIEHLLKHGIYLHGVKMPYSIHYLARYLVSNGCRIYVGPRKRKWFNKE